MILHGALSVFRFELRRTVTVSRIAVWLLLTSFPIFIVGVVKYNEPHFRDEGYPGQGRGSQTMIVPGEAGEMIKLELRREGPRRLLRVTVSQGDRVKMTIDNILLPEGMSASDLRNNWAQVLAEQPGNIIRVREGAEPMRARKIRKVPDTVWGLIFFGLIPEVITLFGLLLWATPVVQAELEGRTWIYLAVRPRGRVSLLLGKYLTAVTWTALAGCVSATICVQIAQPDEALRLWISMLALVGLACLGYGALYSLIGVLLHRRAMVIAVAYTLIFEFLVSLIPAVINKFTVQYRLRNLLVSFMDWRELLMQESGEAGDVLLGKEPPWLHVIVLIGITISLLAVAAQVIQRKEYATADEA